MTPFDLCDLALDHPAAMDMFTQMGRISAASQLVEVGFTDLAGTPAEYRARLETPFASRTRYLLALEPGTTRVFAFATVVMPVKDNTTLAHVGVVVDPAKRRLGIGSFLAAHVVRFAREHGRTTLSGYSDHAPGSLNPTDGPAVFARGLGATLAQVEERAMLS